MEKKGLKLKKRFIDLLVQINSKFKNQKSKIKMQNDKSKFKNDCNVIQNRALEIIRINGVFVQIY